MEIKPKAQIKERVFSVMRLYYRKNLKNSIKIRKANKKVDTARNVEYIFTMPRVFEIDGYKFFFFSNEGNPLEPCHIHVRKSGNLAKFWISDSATLEENYGFSAAELSKIQKIANEHTKLIKEAWNELYNGKC